MLKCTPDEVVYEYDYTSGGGAPQPLRVHILTEAIRPRPGTSSAAGTAMSGEPYPHCLAAGGELRRPGKVSQTLTTQPPGH